mmetsp:Transcript_1505/g.4829  ORF Transcript_1505/g.4829 Transcript_1505/m.4829 type:complete len:219 (-) Transcript_1505:1131-1787(-)
MKPSVHAHWHGGTDACGTPLLLQWSAAEQRLKSSTRSSCAYSSTLRGVELPGATYVKDASVFAGLFCDRQLKATHSAFSMKAKVGLNCRRSWWAMAHSLQSFSSRTPLAGSGIVELVRHAGARFVSTTRTWLQYASSLSSGQSVLPSHSCDRAMHCAVAGQYSASAEQFPAVTLPSEVGTVDVSATTNPYISHVDTVPAPGGVIVTTAASTPLLTGPE